MPSNHCFHYNYICTLIKRDYHNANNTPDVLYIIYIKTNQCWYCVQSLYNTWVFLWLLHHDMCNHLVFYLCVKHNDDIVTFIRFRERRYSNHISGTFLVKYNVADTLSSILIAIFDLGEAMYRAQWRVRFFFLFWKEAPV